MRPVIKHIEFTKEDIAAGKYDAWRLIEPLWYEVSIYDGKEVFDRDLAPYSRAQRLFLALFWYESEVCNGGHDQFLSNSTGVVWKDALEGLELLGLQSLADNLRRVADMFGGEIPFDRDEREEALQELYDAAADDDDEFPDLFEENDDAFSSLDSSVMDEYARSHPEEFVLCGDFKSYEK